MFVVLEELDAAPHDAAGYGLAGVAFDGLELQGAVDGHDEVDLSFGVAVEGCSVFVTQLIGDAGGDGPAEDRQVEGVRGADGGGGGAGVVGVTGDAGEVEPDDAVGVYVPRAVVTTCAASWSRSTSGSRPSG